MTFRAASRSGQEAALRTNSVSRSSETTDSVGSATSCGTSPKTCLKDREDVLPTTLGNKFLKQWGFDHRAFSSKNRKQGESSIPQTAQESMRTQANSAIFRARGSPSARMRRRGRGAEVLVLGAGAHFAQAHGCRVAGEFTAGEAGQFLPSLLSWAAWTTTSLSSS